MIIPGAIVLLTAILLRKPIMKYYYVLAAGFSGLKKLDSLQKENLKLLIEAFNEYGDGDEHKLYYILATAWHESRLIPVRESTRVWLGERQISDSTARARLAGMPYLEYTNWNKDEFVTTDHAYYGRGTVQLTWYDNYEKFSDIVGIDLVNNPDEALAPEIAAKITVYGMMNGSFTGRGLSDYINGQKVDYINARRTVNGTDRAQMIAGYATSIESNSENYLS